jgi:effector-binding domain-containing protein
MEEDMNRSTVHDAAASPVQGVDVVTTQPRRIVGLRERVAIADLSGYFARALPLVAERLGRAGIHLIGPPVAVYRDERGQEFVVTVGFPVDHAPMAIDGLVRETLPGGRAVRAVHSGPYESLPETYARLGAWFAQRAIQPPTMMWEEYLVGPNVTGEKGCVTEVVFPLV